MQKPVGSSERVRERECVCVKREIELERVCDKNRERERECVCDEDRERVCVREERES